MSRSLNYHTASSISQRVIMESFSNFSTQLEDFRMSLGVTHFIHGEALFDENAVDAFDVFEELRRKQNALSGIDAANPTQFPGDAGISTSGENSLRSPTSFADLTLFKFGDHLVPRPLQQENEESDATLASFERSDISDDAANFTGGSQDELKDEVTHFSFFTSTLIEEIHSQRDSKDAAADGHEAQTWNPWLQK
mgnify:CR=1 FL=1